MMTLLNRLYRKNGFPLVPATWAILIGMLALTTSACSGNPSSQQPSWIFRTTRAVIGGRIDVSAQIDDNANQNSPIALDLVVIYDEKLLEQLMGMTASEWFEKRSQIRRDYLQGAGFDSWGWEWIPGQKVPVQKLPMKPAALGGVVFAKYIAPGAHRVRINPFQDVTILLRENDFAVNIPKDITDLVEYLDD